MSESVVAYVNLKQRTDVQVRKRWVQESKDQYPNKIPIVVEPNMQEITAGAIQSMSNPKFLFPADFHCAQIVAILRKKLDILPTDALLLFVEHNGRYRLLRPQ